MRRDGRLVRQPDGVCVPRLITIEGSCSLPNSGLKAEDFDKIPYISRSRTSS
jgi:hypothetical protein